VSVATSQLKMHDSGGVNEMISSVCCLIMFIPAVMVPHLMLRSFIKTENIISCSYIQLKLFFKCTICMPGSVSQSTVLCKPAACWSLVIALLKRTGKKTAEEGTHTISVAQSDSCL